MNIDPFKSRQRPSRQSTITRLVCGLLAILLLASCSTTQLAPISSFGAAYQPLPDELELWGVARDEELQLLEEVVIYDDPLLVEYLEGVVDRLNPPSMAANTDIEYRVTVLEDPSLNAFAYPHGSIYIHTGLLSRIENEDQLATVLGHEMSHVESRHMVRYQRAVHNRQVGWSIAALAAAIVVAEKQGDAYYDGDWGRGARIGVLADLFLSLGLELAVTASVNGYGRDLEYEADQGGFDKLAAAGYDPREAPEVYAKLLDDHGEPNHAEAFFFGSHPKLTRRIENAEAWVESSPPAGPRHRSAEADQDFARRMVPVLRANARLNIESGRLSLAETELTRLVDELPGDSEGHFLVGRLRLAQAEEVGEGDAERAAALAEQAAGAFHRAVELAPERPAPYRELGLMAYRGEAFDAACDPLGRYVELAPESDDTTLVRDTLLELRRDGHCG